MNAKNTRLEETHYLVERLGLLDLVDSIETKVRNNFNMLISKVIEQEIASDRANTAEAFRSVLQNRICYKIELDFEDTLFSDDEIKILQTELFKRSL